MVKAGTYIKRSVNALSVILTGLPTGGTFSVPGETRTSFNSQTK